MANTVALQPVPWKVPDDGDLQSLQHVSGVTTKDPWFYHKFVKYTYSAASVAIKFLTSLPLTLRKQVRHIKLVEDRESIAHPECHSRGFIPLGRLCVPGLGAQRIASNRTLRLDSRPTDTSAKHHSAKEAQLRWEKARWKQRVVNLEAEKIALEAVMGKLKEQVRALPVDKVDINTAAIDLDVTGLTFDKSIRCPNMLPASSCDRFAVVGVCH